MGNRVQKIQQHDQATWHDVPTSQHPADLGSRGGIVADNEMWGEGPTWLRNRSDWPSDVTLEPTAETKAKAKITQEILAVVSIEKDEFNQLLDKHSLPKVLRIGAWMRRFIANCRIKSEERSGSIDTEEVE